jgi:hypothetical protein
MIQKSTVLAVMTLLCFACNNKSSEETQDLNQKIENVSDKIDADRGYQASDSTIAPMGQAEEQQSGKKPSVPIAQARSIDWDKKIVKTATLNTEVKDYKTFSKTLSDKIKRFGGYISSEEQAQSEYKIGNMVVIKVPVDQFESAVNDLLTDVTKVNEKRITSDDVTTELIDGKSRLEAKKEVRLRYLELLRQAKNMGEILTVQKEINSIQEEIETVNGRINLLSHSSALSTIQLTFAQILDPSALDENPKETGFLTKTKTAFANGWNWIAEIFVGIVSIWPLMLILFFAYFFFRKRLVFKMKQ